MFLEGSDCPSVTEPFPILAGEGHRVVRVADADDPRQERNVVACQTVRISAAIDAFMMPAHDRADVGKHRRLLDEDLASDRVTFDDLELSASSRPALFKISSGTDNFPRS